MTITTTYDWNSGGNIDASSFLEIYDATGLSNGGFVLVGRSSTLPRGEIYNALGASLAHWQDGLSFTYTDVKQKPNGDLIWSGVSGGSGIWGVRSSTTGAVISGPASIDASSTAVDDPGITALPGGDFVTVTIGNDPTDGVTVFLRQHEGNGAEVFEINLPPALAIDPVVVTLDGGGYAVGWTVEQMDGTHIYYAMYNNAGEVIAAPTEFGTAGAISEDVDMCALNGGGFAMVWEDNGWDGDADISLGVVDANGAIVDGYLVTVDATAREDSDPRVVRMSNGLLAVSYTTEYEPGSHDIYVTMMNPVTGESLVTSNIAGAFDLAEDAQDSSAAAVTGGAAVFYEVEGLGATGGRLIGIRRTDGDGTKNVIVGDDFVDSMRGFGGDDTLSGAGANDALVGGAGADTLTGGAGDDYLDGGPDKDVMTGGAGNDTYVVGSAGDVVNEAANAGADTLYALISMSLIANLENLRLIGTNPINGTGNGAANVIFGNGAANTLRGGASNDILEGGASADALRGDGGSDTASYTESIGRVRVNLTTGIGLDADAQGDTYESIERLTGTNFNDQLIGSSVGNVLIGGTGVDIIDGRGGQDFLFGGGGDDVFLFSAGLGAADRIDDFSVGNDTIRLDNNIFTGLAAGALPAPAFRIGAAAADASDRIIYNSANGFLYFDRDGTGAQTAIHFATLDTGLAMTAGDFAVV